MTNESNPIIVDITLDHDEQMSRFLKPSLHCRVAIKIAVTFWTNYFLVSLGGFDLKHEEMKDLCKKKEDEIRNKVPDLELTPILEIGIQQIVELTGYQILAWVAFHGHNNITVPVPSQFVWTSHGTINLKETAVSLLNNNVELDADVRYKLACIYCLDDRIPALWNETSTEFRELQRIRETELPIVSYWSHRTTGRLSNLEQYLSDQMPSCSTAEYVFRSVVDSGNELATKHFISKLTSEGKLQIVEQCAISIPKKKLKAKERGNIEEYYGDVLCLLVFSITPQQRKRVFKENKDNLFHILECLTEWPWHVFFMSVVKDMWQFLSKEQYESLLLIIYAKTCETYTDHKYKTLLNDFWEVSPKSHKTYLKLRYQKYLNKSCDDKDIELDVSVTGKSIHIFKNKFAKHILSEKPEEANK